MARLAARWTPDKPKTRVEPRFDGRRRPPGGDMHGDDGEEYQVLARKYRPSTFADLVGQDAMVRTLKNAFAADRIAQEFRDDYYAARR